MMKILLCSFAEIKRELGCSKNLIELAEELEQLGWKCDLVGYSDIVPVHQQSRGLKIYSESLRLYLQKYAHNYDVVLYEHEWLPYARAEFCSETLFVARPALLLLHFKEIIFPRKKRLKSLVRKLIWGWRDQQNFEQRVRNSLITLREADLIQAINEEDKTKIIQQGISSKKIIVVSNAIDRKRRPAFDQVSSHIPFPPKVAFVGTFDYRKGGVDFPKIVQRIHQQIPNITFRLLGTRGLYKTERQVLSDFPKRLRSILEVIPHYPADELPALLEPCSVGIFPSYIEGFGFGVLEMLAASVPVIAYNAPGPPMMLPPEYLVRSGDVQAMSQKVIQLLQNPEQLMAARIWAKQRSQDFNWSTVAITLDEKYRALIKERCTHSCIKAS